MTEYKNLNKTNILDIQDESDINLYFSSYGVQTFYNLIRMSMLSKKEVHFYRSNKLISFHKDLNVNEFEHFLKNNRKVNDLSILKNSGIHELGDYKDESTFFDKALEFVKNNPDKKIGIWTNSDHFVANANKLSRLSKFDNVQIFGIEDSNLLEQYIIDNYYKDNKFIRENQNPKSKKWKNPIINSKVTRWNQYLIPMFYKNIKVYWSDPQQSKNFEILGINNHFSFFNEEGFQKLKDEIFQRKDKYNKRYSIYWAKITGYNWEKERDKVNKIQNENNKESLIILGTNSTNDQDSISKILLEYGDQYNIYYKGHPGMNANASFIINKLKPGAKISFFDYETQQRRSFTIDNSWKITALETQIQSEELTSDHANEKNGIWFNKWIGLDGISSALYGILNKRNTYSNILFLGDSFNKKLFKKGTQEFNAFLNKIAAKGASSSVIISKINNKSPKDAELEDFVFKTSLNSGFKIIKAIIQLKY
ncbi:hypothetical protein [Mycoplasmopsis cynos]|uniref:hypothetical protein n=3 Tax=Mycoplasmopsis cynos TaxID=171284 RepID=UPI0024C753A9|nr:hypothetical protein [Mycoplasmopsis cynos]WAM08145.1 hypothetical protein ONA21_02405 [Mycoplasmopsis cynos]